MPMDEKYRYEGIIWGLGFNGMRTSPKKNQRHASRQHACSVSKAATSFVSSIQRISWVVWQSADKHDGNFGSMAKLSDHCVNVENLALSWAISNPEGHRWRAVAA